ncbi:hypothetical protein [Streptococcus uberis]|uniref:hypothetical protein n=1 Tax=Streptococcus uberis TaxID=1349 RepID=UPI001EF140B9|nr:hypothetical protein [Streptococcus uberis]
MYKLSYKMNRLSKCFQEDWKYMLMLLLIFALTLSIGYYIGNNQAKSEYEPRISGLHKQLKRTQHQLKKATDQNIEQTQKIAELTGNGG